MPKEDKQQSLFNDPEWWQEHWDGMPEFDQKDLAPWKSIYVHFENFEDMQKFSELIGQKIMTTTQSIWYPQAKIGRTAQKVYTTKGYKKK